jgi:hypothetical protein
MVESFLPTTKPYCGDSEANPFPTDTSFDIEVDTLTTFLETSIESQAPYKIPEQIEELDSDFGKIAAQEALVDDSFDGFEVVNECLTGAACGALHDPCPFTVPGTASFETAAAAFKTSTGFLIAGQWGDIPGCI